jgi:hypothetical protein
MIIELRHETKSEYVQCAQCEKTPKKIMLDFENSGSSFQIN